MLKASKYFRRLREPPTALLAWEIGAGFTHTQNLWGVVRHLRHMGVRCVIATADPRFETWFRALGADVVQTFLWPAMRSGMTLPTQRPNRVLTDILANYGVSRPLDLKGAIAHYDTLFGLVKPDIVLCENAFGAVLAARGRFPVMVFGSTLLFMPPVVGDGFAPIDLSEPTPSWSLESVLDDVNAALGASARMPLSRVSEILTCQALVPFGPAAFDPYLGARSDRVYSPHCPDLPHELASQPGEQLVVYLHEVAQMSEPLMRAIAELPAGARLYIPNLAPELRSLFQGVGHVVEERMISLRSLGEQAGLLVHQGGVTLSSAALALGIPQIILARFHENGLAGRFVAGEELGYTIRMDKVDCLWIKETVARALSDSGLTRRARARAPEFRSWFAEDPTAVVANIAAELLNIPLKNAPPVADHHLWSPI